ncbi:MAG: V-type ATPase 116kDa subunit family protein [Thermoproteota archaeon]
MGLLVARSPPLTIVAVPSSRLVEAAKALAESGVFHPASEGDEKLRTSIRRARGEAEVAAQRARMLLEKIGVEPSGEKVTVELSTNLTVTATRIVAEASRVLESAEDKLGPLLSMRGIGDIVSYIDTVKSLPLPEGIDLVTLRSGRHIRVTMYLVAREEADELAEALAERGAFVQLNDVDEQKSLLAVVYRAEDESEIEREAASRGALPIVTPHRLPSREEVEEIARDVAGALAKLEALLGILSVLESARLTRFMAFFAGYVPKGSFKKLRESLEKSLGRSFTVFERPAELGEAAEAAPVTFSPPRLLKPLANLLGMYGYPAPGEFVPLLLMGVTFPVIFGLMFPDVGHGLLLLLAGAYFATRARSSTWRDLGRLLVMLSIPAMFFGALSAEFFGPATPMAHWLEEMWHGHPPYSSPVHAIYTALVAGEAEAGALTSILTFKALHVSLTLGAILLALASWLGLAKALVEGHPEETVHRTAVALAFTGILIVLLYITATGADYANYIEQLTSTFSTTAGKAALSLIAIALLLSFLGPLVMGHEGLGQRVVSSFVEAFDLFLVMLSNTLSFVRIMGLMLAHSGLVFGFFIIAVQVVGGGKPLAVDTAVEALVYGFGNLFVAGFEAFIASIHTLRLHFYEMFTKFYSGAGRIYRPVRIPENIVLTVSP